MSLAKLVCAAVLLLCCATEPDAAQPHGGGPPGDAPFAGVRGMLGVRPLPPPPDGAVRVMTDTPEYCRHLANLEESIETSRTAVSPNVHNLAVAGREMCERGLLFGGLQRLRLALELLHSGR